MSLKLAAFKSDPSGSGNFHAGQKACANCVEAGGRLSHESTFAGPA